MNVVPTPYYSLNHKYLQVERDEYFKTTRTTCQIKEKTASNHHHLTMCVLHLEQVLGDET
jgi:hypothetical protein